MLKVFRSFLGTTQTENSRFILQYIFLAEVYTKDVQSIELSLFPTYINKDP